MIKNAIQAVCIKRNIVNAAKLAEICRFSTSVAYPLFKGSGTRIDFRHLDTLCRVLKCKVGDLLAYVPDGPESPEPARRHHSKPKATQHKKSPVEIIIK